MNEMPKPQKFLTYLSWAFAGLMMLGGVISVINDTLDLVTLPVSLVGTGLVFIFYFGAQQYLKHYGWQTEYGLITRLNIGMVLPLVGMIALLWLPQLIQLAPGSRAFPRATPDEALIVIATFHRTEGVVDSAIHDEIRRGIQQQIDALNLEKVRVAVEPTVIPSANREQAEALGEKYNATLIIWGEETSVRLEVNFHNLKEPEFAAAEAVISETDRTQISAIANPEAYSQFVIAELPGQLTYLALFALAQAEISQDNYAEATVLLETAVASLPDLTEVDTTPLQLDTAHFRLSWLYQVISQLQSAIVAHDQAIADYDQAIALNPEYAEAFNNRGTVYANLGNYERAIADYDQAIALNPEDVTAFNNRGIAYANQGNYERAIADYDQAIALNPEYAIAFNNRGLAYRNLAVFERAIADFDQAIALNPEYAIAFFNRALVFLALGQNMGALHDLQIYLELDSQSQWREWVENRIGELEAELEN
jgi:tetratricopeptide (TPR) repeat protein